MYAKFIKDQRTNTMFILSIIKRSLKNLWTTLKGIYKFLGIPPFKHHFVNLDQVIVNGLGYDDTILGTRSTYY